MQTREWALVIYTLLTQMAVGSFVVLGIVHFYAMRKAGAEQADKLSDRALIAIGPVLVLGILASLFHLGNPINAPRAITNVASSWLSREILFTVLFAVFGAVFAFAQWRKISTFATRNVIAWIAALLGLGAIYSMSHIYMLQAQPAWDSLATPVQFFSTAFLAGALAIGSAFVANYAYVKQKEPECADVQCGLLRNVVRGIALASVVLLGIEVLAYPLQMAYLVSTGNAAALQSVSMTFGQYGVLLALRLALVVVGAGLFGLFLFRYASVTGMELTMGNLVYAAFVLVLASEAIGRFLFYATQVRIGI
jgi:anaerobic dimethyl sulfoxide reductase subunit C (anchor subunit)